MAETERFDSDRELSFSLDPEGMAHEGVKVSWGLDDTINVLQKLGFQSPEMPVGTNSDNCRAICDEKPVSTAVNSASDGTDTDDIFTSKLYRTARRENLAPRPAGREGVSVKGKPPKMVRKRFGRRNLNRGG